MNYDVLRSPQALRQLRHLQRTHPSLIPSLIAAITAISDNPRPAGATKLVNRPEWRIRVGNHRVLYQIDDKNRTVTVVSISHRRDVYR
jgi:mRNA interferase RelE/StbE